MFVVFFLLKQKKAYDMCSRDGGQTGARPILTMIACPGKTRSSDSQSPEYQSINAMQLVCQSIASTGICASMTSVGASRPPSDQGAYGSGQSSKLWVPKRPSAGRSCSGAQEIGRAAGRERVCQYG